MTALLLAFATGFYGDLPHSYAFRFTDMAACESARPAVEARMAAHGQVVTLTECKEVKERAI